MHAGLEEAAERRDAVEVEAELRCHPRQCDEQRAGGNTDPQSIAGLPAAPCRAGASHGRREHDRDQHADRRERIDPLCVEISLVDDARPEHDSAQDEGDECRRLRRAAGQLFEEQGEDRHRNEREREVGEHERATNSAREAAACHVIQLARRQSRIRHDNLDGDNEEQRPDENDLEREGPFAR